MDENMKICCHWYIFAFINCSKFEHFDPLKIKLVNFLYLHIPISIINIGMSNPNPYYIYIAPNIYTIQL